MSNNKNDVPIIVPKELRNRIKSNAAKDGRTMRGYLEKVVPKD